MRGILILTLLFMSNFMSSIIPLRRQGNILRRADEMYYTGVSGEPNFPPPDPPSDEFIIGVTRPTAANTGPQIPENQLQNYAGSFTNLQAGDVVENLAISKIIDVGSGDGPGTFKNCLVLYGQPPTWPSSSTTANTYPGVKGWGSHNGATFIQVEFRPDPNFLSHDIYGPQGAGRVSPDCKFDFIRCHVQDTVDGMVLHGSSGVPKQAKVLGCFIERVTYYAVDPRQGPEGAHPDGIQNQGNLRNLEIVGTFIQGGGTSCILFGNNIPGGYQNVLVKDNWCLGNPSSGSTINWAAEHSSSNPMSNITVIRNRIATNGNTPGFLVRQSVRNLSTTNLGLDGGGTGNPVKGSANGNDYQCNVQMNPTTYEIIRDGSGFVVPYTVSNG